MPAIWIKLCTRITVLLLAGVAVGWLYEAPLLGLLAACASVLLWQLINLFKLYSWLHGKKLEFLPDGDGVWALVFARINFIRERSRRRSARFRAMLKGLRSSAKMFPDGGIILNDHNEIVIFNRAARELLGLRKKRDRGQRIENLIRNPEFVDYVSAGEFESDVEIKVATPLEGWLSCHIVPYGPDQRLLLLRDISKQHEADEIRREFIANASHELRTPLTVVSGYIDALADEPSLQDDFKGPVKEMQRQTQRMQDLVTDLLQLSELESETRELKCEVVALAPILETARQEALATEGCPLNVTVVLDSEQGLLGDERQLQSIVSNLVANAARHTSVEGEVVIKWEVNKKGGWLSVSDTGSGIPREHLSRLTERFYRVETGRNRSEGGGTGLGLSIVRHALLQHDAALEIESILGKGSVFSCHFPAERLVAVN